MWRTSTLWRFGSNFSQMWRIGTKSSHVWRIGTKSSHLWKIGIKASHVKIGIKTHTCEEMIPKPHTCEKLLPIYHTYEELVLDRHRCQWQNCVELESNVKCSRFGGILSMWGIRMYAIWNLISCVFFTKCEILVRNMWRIGANFSRAVRNWYQFFTVWTVRSVKFAVQHSY